jgi:hypothetical protein
LGGTSTTLEVAEAICNEIVKNWIWKFAFK